ncbi:MAG: hypothetical protein RLZZ616_1714, partial [Pseudomonadota bacterium]
HFYIQNVFIEVLNKSPTKYITVAVALMMLNSLFD